MKNQVTKKLILIVFCSLLASLFYVQGQIRILAIGNSFSEDAIETTLMIWPKPMVFPLLSEIYIGVAARWKHTGTTQAQTMPGIHTAKL